MSEFVDIWKDKGAPPDLLKIIRTGHVIQFEELPPMSMPLKKFESKLSPEQSIKVKAEIEELVAKKAMRVLSYYEAVKDPGFYSKVFVVPTPNGKHVPRQDLPVLCSAHGAYGESSNIYLGIAICRWTDSQRGHSFDNVFGRSFGNC